MPDAEEERRRPRVVAGRPADGVPDADPDVPEQGTWVDVYALHFPRDARPQRTFDRGVGHEGYDRGTGVEVPHHPMLRRRGAESAAADPFATEGRDDPTPDE